MLTRRNLRPVGGNPVEVRAVFDVAVLDGGGSRQTLSDAEFRVDDTALPDDTADRPRAQSFAAARRTLPTHPDRTHPPHVTH